MRARFIVTGLLAVALLPVVACMSSPEPIRTQPDCLGFITEIQSDRIIVESHADKIVDRYVVTINNETAIFQQEGENLRHVSAAEFETKQWLRIWFSGPVMESWPKQATARQIVINETTLPDVSTEAALPEPSEEPLAVQWFRARSANEKTLSAGSQNICSEGDNMKKWLAGYLSSEGPYLQKGLAIGGIDLTVNNQ